MTSDSINTEMAWEDFKEKRSFEKAASIQGQLDTMAALHFLAMHNRHNAF